MLKALSSFQFKFEMVAEGEMTCASLGITNYPTTFIIDRSGIIKEVSEGVPVKTRQGKSFDESDEEMKFIIYETYSKVLSDFLKKSDSR
jgi:peroxiredoxin